MKLIENRFKYREAIGEFITAFAEVELYLSLYDYVINSRNTVNPNLVISFAKNLSEKLKTIDDFLKRIDDDTFYQTWIDVKAEILDLQLNRHYIIHGTGFSDFHAETFTAILDEGKKQKNTYS